MKNSKLYFPIILLILITSFKITTAQTKFGVKTGLNITSAIMEDENGDKNSTKPTPGFHIGLTVDIPLFPDFYLQPAALYSNKGFRQTDSWFSGSGNELKLTVSYFEVPVNFVYKPKFGTGRLLLGAGPYAGYGTGGKWKSETNVTIGDIVIDNKGAVIFKNDSMDGEFGNYLYGKPWDYGVNVLAGYEFFEAISVQLNAQLGLANLAPDVDGQKRDGKLKNTGFGISVGYKF